MKKLLLPVIISLFALQANAQEIPGEINDQNLGVHNSSSMHRLSDPVYQTAVGLQYTYPYVGLSVKYAVTPSSVLNLIASPSFGYLGGGGNNNAMYFLRYIYRFPMDYYSFFGPFTAAYPYIFAGGGIVHNSYNNNDNTGNLTASKFGYMAGIGYETICKNNISGNLELGYGSYTANGGSLQGTAVIALGVHYYFCMACGWGNRPNNDQQSGVENNGEEQQPNEEEQQPEEPRERKEVKPIRRHHHDNDDE